MTGVKCLRYTSGSSDINKFHVSNVHCEIMFVRRITFNNKRYQQQIIYEMLLISKSILDIICLKVLIAFGMKLAICFILFFYRMDFIVDSYNAGYRKSNTTPKTFKRYFTNSFYLCE